jgi:hypothetical protein
MNLKFCLFALLFHLHYCNKIGDWSSDTNANKWRDNAKAKIDEVLKNKRITNIAKNTILFLGNFSHFFLMYLFFRNFQEMEWE